MSSTTGKTKDVAKASANTQGIQFICPFHGKVTPTDRVSVNRTITKAVDKNKPPVETTERVGGWKCPIDGCTVERAENECEYIPVKKP